MRDFYQGAYSNLKMDFEILKKDNEDKSREVAELQSLLKQKDEELQSKYETPMTGIETRVCTIFS